MSLNTICIALLCLTSLSVNAASNQVCEQNEQCVDENQWSLGVALGLGLRTNPLVDGDNIPQVILLDVAYYSDYVYFDNGELGVKWLENERLTVSSYLTLDRERALFTFWDPANISTNISAAAPPVDPPPVQPGEPVDPGAGEDDQVSIEDIDKPDWAILLGSRADYFWDSHKLSIGLAGDVSGAHSGYRVDISYQKSWRMDDWQVHLRPFVTYKSDKLVDYYYGIGPEDKLPSKVYYTGKGGFEPGLSAIVQYKINDQWQFISSASYKKLASGMTDSPLVEENQQSAVFVGFGYRF